MSKIKELQITKNDLKLFFCMKPFHADFYILACFNAKFKPLLFVHIFHRFLFSSSIFCSIIQIAEVENSIQPLRISKRSDFYEV